MSFNNYVFLLGVFCGVFFFLSLFCFLIEAVIRKIKRENVLSLFWACLLGILLPLSHLRASRSTGSHSAPIIPSLDQTFSISVYLVHQNHRHPASPTEQTSYEVYFCFVFYMVLFGKISHQQTNKCFHRRKSEQIPQTCSLDCNNKKLITIYISKDKKREI